MRHRHLPTRQLATRQPITRQPITRVARGGAAALVATTLAGGCGGDDDASTDRTDPADAASEAWQLVFDSEVDVDAKLDHLAESAALRDVLEAFGETGSTMGGISLAPTAVVGEGDAAVITYDVRFGDRVAYGGQTGTIELVDRTWVVGRQEFCGLMASARTPCAGG